jgi:hypothetical protein
MIYPEQQSLRPCGIMRLGCAGRPVNAGYRGDVRQGSQAYVRAARRCGLTTTRRCLGPGACDSCTVGRLGLGGTGRVVSPDHHRVAIDGEVLRRKTAGLFYPDDEAQSATGHSLLGGFQSVHSAQARHDRSERAVAKFFSWLNSAVPSLG